MRPGSSSSLTLPLVVALVAIALGGCMSGGQEQPPAPSTAPPTATAREARSIAHLPDGQPLTNWMIGTPTFEQRYVNEMTGYEPSVGVSPSGAIFYATWSGRADVWRSRDQGATWTHTTPLAPPMSNDPFVHVDSVTGRIFFINMGAPGTTQCTLVDISNDEGQTWTQSNVRDCSPAAYGPAFDHPMIATGPSTLDVQDNDRRMTYLCASLQSPIFCVPSHDGGVTWDEPVDTGLTAQCLFGFVTVAPTGVVYLPRGCGDGQVGISRDDGRTWDVVNVSSELRMDSRAAFLDRAAHLPAVSGDAAGNVYYLFVDPNFMPHLTISRDAGRTWSTPFNISRPGLTAAHRLNVIAGNNGTIWWAYVGTESPGGHEATPETTWNVYAGYGQAMLGNAPHLLTTMVNPEGDPVKRGDCDGRCGGVLVPPIGEMGGMGDFLKMAVDPTSGFLVVPYIDFCDERCAAGDPVSTPRPRAGLGVQTAGPSLFDSAAVG